MKYPAIRRQVGNFSFIQFIDFTDYLHDLDHFDFFVELLFSLHNLKVFIFQF